MWNWGVFGVELRGGVGTEGFLVWNWGVFGVELRGLCWTEGFLVWNWGISEAEKVWSTSGTDVLNWGVCVELRGTQNFGFCYKLLILSTITFTTTLEYWKIYSVIMNQNIWGKAIRTCAEWTFVGPDVGWSKLICGFSARVLSRFHQFDLQSKWVWCHGGNPNYRNTCFNRTNNFAKIRFWKKIAKIYFRRREHRFFRNHASQRQYLEPPAEGYRINMKKFLLY